MVKKSLHTTEMTDSPDEFEAMYVSNERLIYRFMFWRTKNEALAQDLTSNVFEKAWKTRGNFKGGSSTAWLYRIARTTLIDYWRKKKDLPVDEAVITELANDDTPLEEVVDQDILRAQLQRAFATLPTDMREVVRLRFIEGLSGKQVAERLNLSEANVRVIQYRALKKLRGYLQ